VSSVPDATQRLRDGRNACVCCLSSSSGCTLPAARCWRGPDARSRLEAEHTSVRFDDCPRERHPETKHPRPRRRKRLTELGEGLRRHPFACVLHLPEHVPVGSVAHVDRHGVAGARRANRVVQQLVDGFGECLRLDPHPAARALDHDVHGLRPGGVADELACPHGHLSRVDRHERAARCAVENGHRIRRREDDALGHGRGDRRPAPRCSSISGRREPGSALRQGAQFHTRGAIGRPGSCLGHVRGTPCVHAVVESPSDGE